MNKRYITVIAFLLLVVTILFNQSTTYILKATDNLMVPLCSYTMYKKAGIVWPPLYLNKDFSNKISELRTFKEQYESSGDVSVYFKLDTSEQDIQLLMNELEKIPEVGSIKYITRDEAFDVYKKLNKDNPVLLEMVTADVLPESVELRLKNLPLANAISEDIKNNPIVDDVITKEVYRSECLAH